LTRKTDDLFPAFWKVAKSGNSAAESGHGREGGNILPSIAVHQVWTAAIDIDANAHGHRDDCHSSGDRGPTFHRREKRSATSVVFEESTYTPAVNPPNAEEVLVEAGKRKVLRGCIEGLPDAFREVLVLRELEEMSYRQIADVTGLPAGTVMSRLSRARKRLEECARARKMESYK
jgi:RNA polymerase sigma factor (sigma-70 family)